jgi:hypothetical protein
MKKVYAVTLRARAEMVVWVEAEDVAEAKRLAEESEYDVMTDWAPRDYSTVRAAKARLSKWPGGEVGP